MLLQPEGKDEDIDDTLLTWSLEAYRYVVSCYQLGVDFDFKYIKHYVRINSFLCSILNCIEVIKYKISILSFCFLFYMSCEIVKGCFFKLIFKSKILGRK